MPLINGGGLFETGAGGSAPKHVQQLVNENYLRWDSLGEFLALAVSLEHLAATTGNTAGPSPRRHPRPRHRHLPQRKQIPRPPGRRHRQPRQPLLPRPLLGPRTRPPNRRPRTRRSLRKIAERLTTEEDTITAELLAVQGTPADIGGYYRPDDTLATAVMTPSKTLNDTIASLVR